jgi:peptide/nickel transport system permease protein
LIQEAAQELIRSAWLLVPSGGIIGLTVVAFVLFGNAVRDTLTEPWALSQFGQSAAGRPSGRPFARSVARGLPRTDRLSAPPAQYPADVVLAVEGLSVELFGRPAARPVVSDVSFTISKGETLAVVGESGCGKTMMALAILGLLPGGARRSDGRVLLAGQDLTTASRAELAAVRGRRVGYVAQEPIVSLDPTHTVGSQIAEAVRRHTGMSRRDARRRSAELLASVNIPEPAETARRYPHQLSGGMLQRCVIALALSGDPDLLIADEPTTALDVTIQAEILALLRRLRQERGMAMLLVTHDWGVVATAADRAVVMYAGELVEDASVPDLLASPAHPYSRALIASHPAGTIRGQRLPVILGSVPAPGAWPHGCRFAPRCPKAGEECRVGPVAFTAAGTGHLARCLHVASVAGAAS